MKNYLIYIYIYMIVIYDFKLKLSLVTRQKGNRCEQKLRGLQCNGGYFQRDSVQDRLRLKMSICLLTNSRLQDIKIEYIKEKSDGCKLIIVGFHFLLKS